MGMKGHEEKQQQQIEQDLNSIFKEIEKDKPASDFINKVMAEVKTQKLPALYFYKPVISKKIWIIILLSVISVVIISSVYLSSSTTFDIISKYLNFILPEKLFYSFAISLSGFTISYLSSKWVLMAGAIFGIGFLNLYIQQKLEKS